MKPSDLKKLMTVRFKNNVVRPIHIESSPGTGKTQITSQIASELNVGFMSIHAPLLQPEDYGFPVISADRSDVNFIVSKHKFPLEESNCPEQGIFLIDEMAQADSSAQKILANLIQEREIHGKKLKKGWVIVSTGNRAGDRAGANRLLSHLKNRLTTVELDANLDDWTNWAMSNGVKTELISFIRFRPDLLNSFDPKNEINATPRAWTEGVNRQLGTIPVELEFEAFKGDVGEGAASEFLAFLKIFRELPNPDAILLDPKGANVPTDPATLYALMGALTNRAKADNFMTIMDYVKRVPQEYSVLFVRDALKMCPEIQHTKDFIQWVAKEGQKIFG